MAMFCSDQFQNVTNSSVDRNLFIPTIPQNPLTSYSAHKNGDKNIMS